MLRILKAVVLLLLLLPGPAAHAQAPDWQELHLMQGDKNRQFLTAFDTTGNVYLAGNVSDNQELGRFKLSSEAKNSTALFVAKWSVATCEVAWVQQVDVGVMGSLSALAVANGAVYIAGSYDRNTECLGTPLVYTGRTRVFVAKLTEEAGVGVFRWALPITSTRGGVSAAQLVVQGSSVYLAGEADGDTLHLGRLTLPVRNTLGKSYVAKLVDAGAAATWAWAQQLPGPAVDANITGLAVADRRVYVLSDYWEECFVDMPATARTPARQVRQTDFIWQLTRLTDNGPAARPAWTLTGPGQLWALAVAGHQVYAGGSEIKTNILDATWKGLPLASSKEYLVLHKAVDEDTTAHLGWTQRLSGAGYQWLIGCAALAVRGPSVFMAGTLSGTSLTFGNLCVDAPSGTQARTTTPFVACLHDLGATSCFAWVQPTGNVGFSGPGQLSLQGSKLYVRGIAYQSPAGLGSHRVAYWATPTGNTWWGWLPVER